MSQINEASGYVAAIAFFGLASGTAMFLFMHFMVGINMAFSILGAAIAGFVIGVIASQFTLARRVGSGVMDAFTALF